VRYIIETLVHSPTICSHFLYHANYCPTISCPINALKNNTNDEGLLQVTLNSTPSTAASSITSRGGNTIDSLSRLQRQLYQSDEGEVENKSTEEAVKRIMKEKVLPYIKFVDSDMTRYNQPDFTDLEDDTSNIAKKLLEQMGRETNDLDQKVKFWIQYRKIVRTIVSDHRCNAAQKMKDALIYGESL
jgi:hypothetical protein